MRRTWVAALAAAVAACGQGRTGAVAMQSSPPVQGGTQQGSGGPPCGGLVTVHLDGVDPGEVGSLQLPITGMSFDSSAAHLVPERSASGTLDVAAACQELAVLALPADPAVKSVHGWVTLGTPHACVGGSCLDLDACTHPLAFGFDPTQVSPERCDVIVRFDLARSVFVADGIQAFVPTFSVHY